MQWRVPRRTPKAQVVINDALDNLEAARKRLGEDPEDQLRWVVNDFARKDLRTIFPGEREAAGYALRVIPSPMVTRTKLKPLPDDVVLRVQRQVLRGLKALLTEERSFVAQLGAPDAGWKFPTRSRRLVRMNDPNDPTRKRVRIRWVSDAKSELESIMAAIGELVVTAGSQLRCCPVCAAPFVARKRQAYCSPRCSQQTRDGRKTARRREERRSGRKAAGDRRV